MLHCAKDSQNVTPITSIEVTFSGSFRPKCMSGWFELQVQLPSAYLGAALAGVFASDDARPLTARVGRGGRRLSRLRAGSRRAGGQPHRKSQTQSSLQLVISLTFFAPSQIGKILVGAKTKPYRAVMKKVWARLSRRASTKIMFDLTSQQIHSKYYLSWSLSDLRCDFSVSITPSLGNKGQGW